MALNKQIFCFSVDTSAFYEPDEQFYHERMLKLYRLRKKYKDKTHWGDKDLSWKKSAVNRVLAK